NYSCAILGRPWRVAQIVDQDGHDTAALVSMEGVAEGAARVDAQVRAVPVRWVAFDEVYGRSGQLRKTAAWAGLAFALRWSHDADATKPKPPPAGTTTAPARRSGAGRRRCAVGADRRATRRRRPVSG